MAGRRITYAEIEEVARRYVRGMRIESIAASPGVSVSRASIYSWVKNGNPEFERAVREARLAKVREDCSPEGWAPMVGVGKPSPAEPLSGSDDANMIPTGATKPS